MGLGGQAGVDERGLPVLAQRASEQEGVRFHQQALRKERLHECPIISIMLKLSLNDSPDPKLPYKSISRSGLLIIMTDSSPTFL